MKLLTGTYVNTTATQHNQRIPLRSHSTATQPDSKTGARANHLEKPEKPIMKEGSNQIVVISPCL